MKLKLKFVYIGLLSIVVSGHALFAEAGTSCFDLDPNGKISYESFQRTSAIFKAELSSEGYSEKLRECFRANPLAFSLILNEAKVLTSLIDEAEFIGVTAELASSGTDSPTTREDYLRFLSFVLERPITGTPSFPPGTLTGFIYSPDATADELFRLKTILSRFKGRLETYLNDFRGALNVAGSEYNSETPVIEGILNRLTLDLESNKSSITNSVSELQQGAHVNVSRLFDIQDKILADMRSLRFKRLALEAKRDDLREYVSKLETDALVPVNFALKTISEECVKRTCDPDPKKSSDFRKQYYLLLNSTNSASSTAVLEGTGVGSSSSTNQPPAQPVDNARTFIGDDR